ncbi:MAG TPA: DUF664 domain-containing protein [Acidimicrobiales bacterium]|nr:DUF664 domain-containing protein [Acidimicrobiales bacterium]
MLTLSLDDYLWFVDEALAGMAAIVTELGDELANRRPDLPGANSPYAILTHCLGVIEWWAGHAVAGRVVERDRDAEFRAAGPVAALATRVEEARRRLRADVATLDSAAPLRGTDGLWPEDADLPIARTQGGALFHIYEELAQHRGQMEGGRDLLLAAG